MVRRSPKPPKADPAPAAAGAERHLHAGVAGRRRGALATRAPDRVRRQRVRTHSAAQVKEIAAAIKEWGFTTAVLVDESGTIIAGHGRVAAAKQLKLTHVPVMVARGWTDAQKKAYVIADNKLALNAGWDDALLAAKVLDLKGMEFDLELTGLSEKELAELLAEEPEPTAGEKSGGRTQQAVIQFKIVFDDELQQAKWCEFVRALKARYPNDETLGQRIARFVGEQAPAPATDDAPAAAGAPDAAG